MSGEDRPFHEWFTGKKEYEFGDLTRAFVRKADKALEWLSKKASEFVNAVESADTQRRIASETESGGNRVRERSQASGGHTPVSAATGPSSSASSSSDSDGRVDVELVWDSLMNRAYYFGQHYKSRGLLTKEEFDECEPFLFVGLPALTLFEAALRSVGHKGLVLAAGIEVDEKSYPPEHSKIYECLALLRDELEILKLTDLELEVTRQILLFSSAPDKEVQRKDEVSESRLVLINRLVAKANSVSSSLTQMPFFKEHFKGIMYRLANFSPH
ncbi:uncharacterized protein [Oscarella lobularis]|uniref:uncharacterized protein n=1 Tax=Oscarella lobularis TaxID=121494 RepID=UPI003313C54D